MIVCSVLLVAIIVIALLTLPYLGFREAVRERDIEERLEF